MNKNVEGKPLAIDKKTYEKGIGTHAASVIVFNLPENVRMLHGEGRHR